jgi:hypoxanthine phosphoribosyltransferase
LPLTKEKAYYRAVQRAVEAINSARTLKEKLDTITRGTAVSMKAGASLVLLDASRKKLMHTSSWRLPQSYLRKGVLDTDRSLSEVLSGRPVVISDVGADSRVQYPEMAARAGIVSLLGVPVMSRGAAMGSIRVYSKEPREFTNQDIGFVTSMANLAALALDKSLRGQKEPEAKPGEIKASIEVSASRQARSVVFAHPSEEEFARILDFYNVEWVYEPRSFSLN